MRVPYYQTTAMDKLVKPIFLVGPMGAGKSTIGRLLAQALQGSFIDHDDYIIEQAHMSIPQIFERYGEPYFRNFEHECLQTLLTQQHHSSGPQVIAGGGGIAQRADNRALITEHSICIYLHLDVEGQYQRVKGDSNRPMIQVADIKQRLQELFVVRDPQFRAIANVIIDTNDTPERIVAQALKSLGQE